MIGARNVKGGLLLLLLSLLGGLALSLFAFVPILQPPEGFLHYDDVERRLLRLAHIGGVMLPLLNILVGPYLDRVRMSRAGKELASLLLLAGAVGLPLALAAEAFSVPLRAAHVSGLPAILITLDVAAIAWAAARTPSRELLGS